MQATAVPALLLIFVFVGTVCGCTYGFDGEPATGSDQFSDEEYLTESHAISLHEAGVAFVEFSNEYLHRDPSGSIRKIIGGKVGKDGRAEYWIFGTISNDEYEYFEVSSQGVSPIVWELPLYGQSINTDSIVEITDAIKAAGNVEGERTVIIAEGRITITTKTVDEMAVSVIDAYSGEVVI